jgi:sugar phosphate permease
MAEKHPPSPDQSILKASLAHSESLPKSSGEVSPEILAVANAPNAELQAFYRDFAARDPAQRAAFEKKLVRKIDFRLLPILVIMYLNNFLDRSALAQARIGTLEEDLGMTGTDFNLATSILFVGYLTMQLPSNLLITRVRPSWYLGGVMAIWGIVCGLTAVVQNFAGLLVVRVFLGVTEAPFFPGGRQ